MTPKWKRSKTVTADDLILYTENPEDATRKLLELSEFGIVVHSIVTRMKIHHISSTCWLLMYLSPLLKIYRELMWMRTNHWLSKLQNYWVKRYADEINQRWYKQMERYIMFFDWKNQFYQNKYTIQSSL